MQLPYTASFQLLWPYWWCLPIKRISIESLMVLKVKSRFLNTATEEEELKEGINIFEPVEFWYKYCLNIQKYAMFKKVIFTLTTIIIISAACSKNPITGRNQLNLVSEAQVENLAVSQYKQFLSESKVVSTQLSKPASFLHMFFSCTFDIRIVCIITGHITVSTHVPPM